MPETNLTSDRYFDLSLRLLTIFVMVSLICCVTFLAYNYLEPKLHRVAPMESSLQAPVLPAPAPAPIAKPAPADEVLMDPRKTFQCVDKGRVSFSDRACDIGDEKLLPLKSSQGAAPVATQGATAPAVQSPAGASAGAPAAQGAQGAAPAAGPNDRGAR